MGLLDKDADTFPIYCPYCNLHMLIYHNESPPRRVGSCVHYPAPAPVMARHQQSLREVDMLDF